MTSRFITRLGAALATTAASAGAWAHEGHGLTGPHWHATDAGVFAALVVVAVAALWLGRK